MEIKKVYISLVLMLILALGLNLSYGASVAKQVDFLAAGLEQDGDPLSGGLIYTYEAGTTTAKTCWTDRNKTTPETNPAVLDSEGRSTTFCDGVYKMVVKDSTGTTIVTMDGISYGGEGLTTTKMSSYAGLSEAIADIGGSKKVLIIDTTDTLNENVTVPSNVTLMVMERDAITLNSKTLTVNGDIWAGAFEWVIGTGTFAGSPIVQFYDPTWTASTVTDSATPSYKAINIGTATIINATTSLSVLNSIGSISNRINFINTVSYAKGADIASAATLQLGSDGNYFDVTGTTNISNISGRSVGTTIKLHFDGGLTIINSTNIENIGAVNATTVAGDEYEFVEYGAGQWRMTQSSRRQSGVFRGALVYNSGVQVAADATNLFPLWDSEAYDTDNIHSTVSNTDRLTVPSGVTKVKVSGTANWAEGGGTRKLEIQKNGAVVNPGYGAFFIANAAEADPLFSSLPIQATTPVIEVTGGDYFKMRTTQASGGPLNFLTSTWFAMEIIE